jgi:hypothetical protein
MSRASDIRQQIDFEKERRNRLSVPAFAAGFLYVLSQIVLAETVSGGPTVGVLEGLAPALRGEGNPAISPRAVEVRYISHHSLVLIVGSVLAVVSIGVLVAVLLLLWSATVFRRPQTWPLVPRLLIGGGSIFALIQVVHEVIEAIETHQFAHGHNFTAHAVDHALTNATSIQVTAYVGFLAWIALATGIVALMINALRVGLVPRWMGVLGMLMALLIFLPIGGVTFQGIVPGFWILMMGVLYGGRWPRGDPPAWAAGESRPWPSAAQARAERTGKPIPATAGAGAGGGRDVAPEPMRPVPKATSRKRRKRGGG